jgi:hypothetical protein
LNQRLGLHEVGSILDPDFEVTCAIVTDAANVSAEPLFQLERVRVRLDLPC